MADTFGRQLRDVTDPEEWIGLERTASVDTFKQAEGALLAALTETFSGREVLRISEQPNRVQTVTLTHGDPELVDRTWSEAAQNARGAWWLQGAQTDISVSLIAPRLARLGDTALASIPSSKVRGNPADGTLMFTAVLLEPALTTLLTPLLLRGPSAPADLGKRQAAWALHAEQFTSLGLADGPVGHLARRIRPSGDWRALDRPGRQKVRLEYLQALQTNITQETISRLRVIALTDLVTGVYAKAKAARGTDNLVMPLARGVLTKARQPALSAWFGGDWLALLRYLGEAPNPSEQLVTQLPETPLTVVTPDAVNRVSADTGLSADAIENILRAYHDPETTPGQSESTSRGISGVHDRVAALRTLFERVAHLQTNQQTTGGSAVHFLDQDSHLLGEGLITQVDQLWAGVCLPRYPDKVLTRLTPLEGAVEAAGVALKFWHEIFLTCWYTCAGPYARAEIRDLQEYYGHFAADLQKLGFDIDPAVFTDLIAASKKLGKPKSAETDRHAETTDGYTVTISMSSGSTRTGFEHLRDVVVAHQTAWMNQHLDAYLNQAWREPLEAVAKEFQRTVAAKGKAPTHKQFASIGAKTATSWFGGNLESLYGAIGERAPATSTRVDATNGRGTQIQDLLFHHLGGTPLQARAQAGDDTAHYEAADLRHLTRHAEKWIHLLEALGKPPTAQEFGAERTNWRPLTDDPEQAFAQFSTAMAAVLAEFRLPVETTSAPEVITDEVMSPQPPPTALSAPLTAPKQGLFSRFRRT